MTKIAERRALTLAELARAERRRAPQRSSPPLSMLTLDPEILERIRTALEDLDKGE